MKKTIFTALLMLCAVMLYSQPYKHRYQDPNLSIEERVNDIVSQLTLEEKVGQMMHNAPGIERLGIAPYNWWNECLHGVARTKYKTTVYPQAIGMAATFDKQSLEIMADYTAMEGRAIYNDASSKGNYSIYHGLTYWTPNINIFRDPRWGRGHETYGEDPYLTGTLGKSFVKGLQGTDSKYLKASACAKHYAVHSGPEPERHVFDITVSDYELWDTYLPAFHDLVVDAKVSSVMCAYNAYASKPCCGSNLLMVDILRNQWGFKGYVTSDCGAVDDFWMNHKTHPDKASSAADAVINGTDVECTFANTYTALLDAVKSGLISESKIDESLRRLFTTRMRLGLFDPEQVRPYADVTTKELEKDTHKAHALKMARQSIVLLKNDDNTLPLSKNIKKIAVVGPNANDETAPLANYNGTPSEIITPLEGIKAKLGNSVDVVYEQGITHTSNDFFVPINTLDFCSFNGKSGFQVEYFQNTKLEGSPAVVRHEDRVGGFWREGSEMADGVVAKNSSVRWTSVFVPDHNGEFVFRLSADDSYRLIIDGKNMNEWENGNRETSEYVLKAKKGKKYNIVVEYSQVEKNAFLRFEIGNRIITDYAKLANRMKDADVIVFVGGLSPTLEGEEMSVKIDGFRGGDRTSIALPKVQTDMMKALKETGKPVIFVMMTGSALGCEWEAENIPAIMNAWYGGQAVGEAVADVLFGDYNPAGRLPVTFYKNDKDLPPFEDYSMANRTYRYFKGEPLYAFGHGLSYTTFRYENLEMPETSATDESITVKVKVTNTGSMNGEEVAQLYLTHKNGADNLPIRALKGFERIYLKAGESKIVEFTLSSKELAVVDKSANHSVLPGDMLISVGGCQPSDAAIKKGSAIQKSLKLTGGAVLVY